MKLQWVCACVQQTEEKCLVCFLFGMERLSTRRSPLRSYQKSHLNEFFIHAERGGRKAFKHVPLHALYRPRAFTYQAAVLQTVTSCLNLRENYIYFIIYSS